MTRTARTFPFPLHALLTIGVLAALAGCGMTAPMTTTIATARIAEGNLFCAAKDAVVALQTTAGQPILATGAAKSAVDAACATIGGLAVSPPAPGETVGHVTVTLPTTVSLPLG